jgi:KipI family sensor histidine kinase inhibitor
MSVRYRCREYGDAAVLVEVVAATYERRWTAAASLAAALRQARPPELVDIITTYQDVLLVYDPLRAGPAQVRELVARHDRSGTAPEPRRLEIPVVYGAEHGPDLAPAAADLGLCPDELVELHCGAHWTIRFIASPTGAPFLDGPPVEPELPRLAQPRPRVPPGSVALSGRQCTIYPAPSPGGWRVIGRTPAVLFDLRLRPPAACCPGDEVRFVPIAAGDWARHARPLAPRT